VTAEERVVIIQDQPKEYGKRN